MDYKDVGNFVNSRFAVGLSEIIGLTLIAGQRNILLSLVSGSSLVEVGGVSLTWGQGFLWNTENDLKLDTIGTVYFAATGSTAVISVLKGVTSGNS